MQERRAGFHIWNQVYVIAITGVLTDGFFTLGIETITFEVKVLVGADAQGLSASTISRLKLEWGQQYQQWRDTPLDKEQWAYTWADGIYSGLRAENTKLCALVIIF